MNKRRKHRIQRAQHALEVRQDARAAGVMGILPGLPGGPPYVRPKSPSPGRGRLLMPERLARAAAQEGPMPQYVRALAAYRYRLPSTAVIPKSADS